MDAQKLDLLANLVGEITKEEWNGFECLLFKLRGYQCRLALPRKPADGKPWVWRTLFWNAWPAFDIEMLKRGWHVGFVEHIGFYGCLERTGHLDEFHYAMTERLGLSSMPCLEGFSRGGLTAFNWAAANPTRVLCVYGDNPVCDIRSWPGGKGKGIGAPREWEECLNVLGISDEATKSYRGNPLDRAKTLANFGIPVIIVCGDADKTVPFEENGKLLAERIKAAGGRCEMIVKPGVDHHPHSLENPEPLAKFVTERWEGVWQG
jgi:pimeloyl-ACP methyl ester carboxylesterase